MVQYTSSQKHDILTKLDQTIKLKELSRKDYDLLVPIAEAYTQTFNFDAITLKQIETLNSIHAKYFEV